MNCANHPERANTVYCRTCGKPLCNECIRNVRGVIYCEGCLAERLGEALPASAYAPAAAGAPLPADNRVPSPGLAATLGFIPGVGAMYNGQFMKGVIHVLVFVCMIWMADRFGPIMVPVFFAYVFYSVFDAYKTAHAIELGQPLPDPFGLERAFGTSTVASTYSSTAPVRAAEAAPAGEAPPRLPTGAIVLILLGSLFLLDNLGIFEFHWAGRLWPLILIFVGGWLFAKRWNR